MLHFCFIPRPAAAPPTGYTLSPTESVLNHDWQHFRPGPEFPRGVDICLGPEDEHPRHWAPAPYLAMAVLTPPWTFGCPLPPTVVKPLRMAPPGAPQTVRTRFAASRPRLTRRGSQPPPHRSSLRIWGHAPSRWLSLRKEKRSRTTTGYLFFFFLITMEKCLMHTRDPRGGDHGLCWTPPI